MNMRAATSNKRMGLTRAPVLPLREWDGIGRARIYATCTSNRLATVSHRVHKPFAQCQTRSSKPGVVYRPDR
jgi:hypothetical protein